MRFLTNALAALTAAVSLLPVCTGMSMAQQVPVTAIDVLLEPDAVMLARATAVNARLLKVFPKGFALDEAHRPHMTTLQRFVRTADLDRMYDAVARSLVGEKIASWKLRAVKYYYAPAGAVGVAGIVVEPTADWLRLQQKVIEAVAPFTVETGTEASFHIPPEEGPYAKGLIEYVAAYVPAMSGKNFNPHVSVGVAPVDYLTAMMSESFDPFTFSAVGVSVYQLGNYGTARRKLKAWDVKP